MVTRERSESELTKLRRMALDLAGRRRERPTTVHLLAAIAAHEGPAGALLVDRSLDREAVLKAGRTFDEDGPDPVGRALDEAREVVRRARGPVSTDQASRSKPSISPDSRLVHREPGALHVLVALLSDRRSAAHRSLVQSGIDVSRLHVAALTHALGVVAPRRPTPGAAARPPRAPAGPSPTVVPLLPARPAPAPAEPSRAAVVAARPAVVPPRPPSAPPPRSGSAPPPRPVRPGMPARPSRLADAAQAARPSEPPLAPTPPGALDRALAPALSAIATIVLPPSPERFAMREAEVERLLDVLGKQRANTPCLVGPPGVGKTATAQALAEALAPAGRKLVEISVPALLAGTAARGSLGERLAAAFDDARRLGPALVLFVDDAHELVNLGDEAVAELKVQLQKGDVPLVLATSLDASKKVLESEPQLVRRLEFVEVEEPDESAAFVMVRRTADELAKHHHAAYPDEVVAASVSWSIRYLPGRALPDKAVGLLDLAGARARRRSVRSVGLAELAQVVSEQADVPIERLLQTDRDRMLRLEEHLAERVVGHAAPLTRIAGHLRKAAAGLRQRRPLGSFLLLGPTGVGKTETAKAVAEALFGSPDAMTRVDMSEYAEAHAVARLVGAPPGYVGHEAGGQLTEAVRRRPYQVVLLDEIEKAHPDVLLAFLQVLDEGHLTDGRGRRVDFTSTVVILTSNLGAREMREAQRSRGVGFARSEEPARGSLEKTCLEAAKKALAPELYNRLDEVVFFAPLTRDEVASVAQGMLSGLARTLAPRGIELEVDPAAIEALLDAGGFDPELGARPMRRTIARLVEAPLAELLLRGELDDGAVALVGVEDGVVVVDAVAPEARAAG